MDDQPPPSTVSSSIRSHGDNADNGNNSGICAVNADNAVIYPHILAGKYFKVTKCNDKDTVQANCVQCKALIKGSLKATSNFRLHLKRKHPDLLDQYEKDKIKEKVSGKRKKQCENEEKGLKQTKLDGLHLKIKKQKNDTKQTELDQNILNYVVNSMKPLSTVDDPHFVKIFTDLSEDLHVMSRRTLGRNIEKSQKAVTEKLISILNDLQYVSTTADIWSTKTRSFLGVTAHWIDEDTLKRMSCVLSCNRLKGSHTYDKIAEMLFEIQSSFKLKHEQVVSTTTDNGSNFVKAFREFGLTNYNPDFSDGAGDADVEDYVEPSDSSTTSPSETLYEEALLPDNLAEETTRQLYLPRHLRCASHTLSLLATTDLHNYIRESPISRIHYSAIAKCTLLWNLSRRPKSAELMKECLGHQLIYPCPTRWNSLYDSIVQLIKSKSKLNELFEKLGKSNTFSAIEIEYLEEFIQVMKPIATALDYLQGNDCYYGQLLPTLMSIRTRLDRAQTQSHNLRHFSTVIRQLKQKLESRFEAFFNLSPEVNEAILASCCHPVYKMRWLPDCITAEEKQRIQNLAVYALENNLKQNEDRLDRRVAAGSRRSSSSASGTKEDEDFIIFMNRENTDQPQTSKMELEFISFLNDKGKDISILKNYPNIRQLFIKYNTSLCSSGPVERLFSLAGYIHSPARGCLSDATFKNLVFLKVMPCLSSDCPVVCVHVRLTICEVFCIL